MKVKRPTLSSSIDIEEQLEDMSVPMYTCACCKSPVDGTEAIFRGGRAYCSESDARAHQQFLSDQEELMRQLVREEAEERFRTYFRDVYNPLDFDEEGDEDLYIPDDDWGEESWPPGS